MDDRTPQRFGRYEILGELGRGATGVVYKARDPKINRIVAVKTISLAGQPPEDELDYRARFFREAEAAGRISHPGIVTIFDVGEEPETHAPYIVMEFVNGEALDRMLAKADGRLPVEAALQLALELAEALDCAHRHGVVHRDLKPANILMTEEGHAKIADFGVAKLNLANQTLAGRALGTPAYMSPEQLNGETVDGRSDLFSLGVILYTTLTGYRPFQGNSAVTVSYKVVNHQPMPATLLNTALPDGLDAIIGRAMAKDPAERYQTGMEMVADIRKLQEERAPGLNMKSVSSSVLNRAPQMEMGENLPPTPTQPALVQPTVVEPALVEPAPPQASAFQPAMLNRARGRSAPSQSALGQATSGQVSGGFSAPPNARRDQSFIEHAHSGRRAATNANERLGREDPQDLRRRRRGLGRTLHVSALVHLARPPSRATESGRANASRGGDSRNEASGNRGNDTRCECARLGSTNTNLQR